MPTRIGPGRANSMKPRPAITPIRPPGKFGVFPLNKGFGPHDFQPDVFKPPRPGAFGSGQPGGASPAAVAAALAGAGAPPVIPPGGPSSPIG
ncbi:MAG: hypothetical protein ACRD1X_05175, partial [Vicinamibacteria bacterium]